MDMSAAFNYERTRTHKTPNCRDNYLPDDEDGEQERPKRKKGKGEGVFSCQILWAIKDRTWSTANHQGSIDNRLGGGISYSCAEVYLFDDCNLNTQAT